MSEATPAPAKLYIIAFDYVEDWIPEFLAEFIRDKYGLACQILPKEPVLPPEFFVPAIQAYVNSWAIEHLFDRLPADGKWILGITSLLLWSYSEQALTQGSGSPERKTAVFTTARLGLCLHCFQTLPAYVRYQLINITMHELGHVFGLPHCNNKHCIMTVGWMAPPLDYCDACRAKVDAYLAQNR